MPQFTQDDRLLKVTTPLGDDVLLLDHFFGAESISAPFRFNLRLFSEKDDLQLKELMGQSVTVEIGTFEGDPRYFHGHVVSFSHAGSDGGFTFYDMQVGPWLDFLRRRQNCRIFQELKVEDILQEVFADYGALATFDIKATSKDLLTMCVQYNETDFQFVSRLMEGLGWFYYFDHDDGSHTLVIDKDSPSLSPMPIQPDIEFNDSPGADATDAIDRFESFRTMVPNKLALKTFDFKNPKDPLLAKTDTQHQMGDLPDMEWYEHHGPYTYKEFEEGDDLAKLRLEEAEARSKGFRGSSNCRGPEQRAHLHPLRALPLRRRVPGAVRGAPRIEQLLRARQPRALPQFLHGHAEVGELPAPLRHPAAGHARTPERHSGGQGRRGNRLRRVRTHPGPVPLGPGGPVQRTELLLGAPGHAPGR